MPQFTRSHLFILPHAEEYRALYGVSVEDVLLSLNHPDLHEGLAEGRYTAEKKFSDYSVYVYYYRTLPLQGDRDVTYAIVDFIGYAVEHDQIKIPLTSSGSR